MLKNHSSWTWTVTSDNLSLVEVVNNTSDDANTNTLHDWTHWNPEMADIDNEAGNTTNMMHTFDSGIPNPTLEPDWDVVHEIKWILQKTLKGDTLIHTKGHQDDRRKHSSLLLLAQLNVDADGLARTYQEKYGASHPMVLLFPRHAAAQVHIPEGTITSRLPFVLRLAEHGTQLRNYIRDKNGWSQLEFDTINWEAHSAAVQAHNKQRIHITKMLHEVLSTLPKLLCRKRGQRSHP